MNQERNIQDIWSFSALWASLNQNTIPILGITLEERCGPSAGNPEAGKSMIRDHEKIRKVGKKWGRLED